MPNKLDGFPGAVGYWGNSPWYRARCEQVAAKTRVLLQDKLITRGKPAWLYQPVRLGDAGVVACTCVKDTTKSNDRPCQQCYGVGLAPGYVRFMHPTVHFTAAESASYTLTQVVVSTDFKPHNFQLAAGAVAGTIETQDKAYSNPDSDTWDTHVVQYLREPGGANTVAVEFSTDSGANWFALSAINGANQPVGTGTLRFRVTLTRTSAAVRSPVFEAVRARFLRTNDYSRAVLAANGDVAAGQVLVLRPWVQEQAQSDTGRGVDIEWMGDRSWTAPLDFFDTTLTRDTPACRVDDEAAGPHPFYEYVTGIKDGDRIVLTALKWNEEFGMFTHQSFDERRAQADEQPYGVVW